MITVGFACPTLTSELGQLALAMVQAEEELELAAEEAGGSDRPNEGLVFHWGPGTQVGSERPETGLETENLQPEGAPTAQQPGAGTTSGGDRVPMTIAEPTVTPDVGASGRTVEHEEEEGEPQQENLTTLTQGLENNSPNITQVFTLTTNTTNQQDKHPANSF